MNPDAKGPIRSSRREVFLPLPGFGFVGVSPGGPAPQLIANVIVQFAKGLLGRSIAVIVGPTTQQRVELSQEHLLSEGRSRSNQFTNFLPQGFHFALCGSNQQFVLIFAHSVPQKGKALLNGSDDGLLL